MATDAQEKQVAAILRSQADVLDPPVVTPPPVTNTPPPQPAPPGPSQQVIGAPVGAGENDWVQKFGEEFSGTSIDRTKWNLGEIEASEGNHEGYNKSELGFYVPKQAFLRDGYLVLQAIARKIRVTTQQLTQPQIADLKAQNIDYFKSGWLTKDFAYQTGTLTTAPDKYGLSLPVGTPWPRPAQPAKFEFKYGWAEARMKLPYGTGLWPAFWMLQSNQVWPPEVDIMEAVKAAIYTTMHYGPKDVDQSQSKTFSKTVAWFDDFHTFGVNWTPQKIDWYVDGVLVYSYAVQQWIPTEPMYLILNLAVGGDWPGKPSIATKFPAELLVDWVRVWQRP